MFGELNGGDSMMETLGLQFKDKIYDDMKQMNTQMNAWKHCGSRNCVQSLKEKGCFLYSEEIRSSQKI